MAFETAKAMQAVGLGCGEGYRSSAADPAAIIEEQMAAAVDHHLDRLTAEDELR